MTQSQKTYFSVGGNISGSNITIGDGNVQKLQTASELPSQRTEQIALLKQWLAQLTEEVERLRHDAGEQRATQTLDRDLKVLTQELETSQPRRPFWEVSLKGLQEAAQAVGALGAPILNVTGKLVPLLQALFP